MVRKILVGILVLFLAIALIGGTVSCGPAKTSENGNGGSSEEELYPYLAVLPPDLEGVLQIRYNYDVADTPPEEWQEFIIPEEGCVYITTEFKITNLSGKTISYLEIQEYLKDAEGNTVDIGGFGVMNIGPGQTRYPGGSSSMPSFSLNPLGEIEGLEIVITEISF